MKFLKIDEHEPTAEEKAKAHNPFPSQSGKICMESL
jgi:hypothetical protein